MPTELQLASSPANPRRSDEDVQNPFCAAVHRIAVVEVLAYQLPQQCLRNCSMVFLPRPIGPGQEFFPNRGTSEENPAHWSRSNAADGHASKCQFRSGKSSVPLDDRACQLRCSGCSPGSTAPPCCLRRAAVVRLCDTEPYGVLDTGLPFYLRQPLNWVAML